MRKTIIALSVLLLALAGSPAYADAFKLFPDDAQVDPNDPNVAMDMPADGDMIKGSKAFKQAQLYCDSELHDLGWVASPTDPRYGYRLTFCMHQQYPQVIVSPPTNPG